MEGGREELRTMERRKTHEGRQKGNKEETRKRKEYISAVMNYSAASKKRPHYWCCCALASTFFFFWGSIFSLELQHDLIFHGLVVFHDPRTRKDFVEFEEKQAVTTRTSTLNGRSVDENGTDYSRNLKPIM